MGIDYMSIVLLKTLNTSPTLFGVFSKLLVEGRVIVLILVLVLLDKPHQGGKLPRDALEVELPLVIESVNVLELDGHLRDLVDDFLLGRQVRAGIDHQDGAWENRVL